MGPGGPCRHDDDERRARDRGGGQVVAAEATSRPAPERALNRGNLMTRRRTPLVALFVLLVIVTAACRPAAQRFAELNGPLRDNVVFPDEFGIDVSHRSVPVAPLMNEVRPQRPHSRLDAIDVTRPADSARRTAA